MKSIVWDFDDTIANSYPGIVAATQESLRENFGISLSKDTIFKESKKTSVRKYVTQLLQEQDDVDAAVNLFYKTYHHVESQYHDKITLIPHVLDALKYCDEKHYIQFVVTHRDNSIYELVKNLGIEHYFKEVVSVENGYQRKPDPDMLNYLMSKYDLKAENLWVIGDRKIDVDFGRSVGAHTILLNDSNVDFDYDNKINDLLEIKNLL
ncbi:MULTISPECIES: HAD-IA family hydrolase [unclassified Companilactobacillus]|uniref:HAD-IA family hydrolase n=1 Tax=unclassified Companilactobacillus TaxID=2767904 RepID=UPI002FF29A12